MRILLFIAVLLSSCSKVCLTSEDFMNKHPYDYLQPYITKHYNADPKFVSIGASEVQCNRYMVKAVTIVCDSTTVTKAIMTSSMKVISIHYANE